MACMALIPKWTFSSSEGGCVSYMYGGCRGSDNLFDTKEECQQKCQDYATMKTAEVRLLSKNIIILYYIGNYSAFWFVDFFSIGQTIIVSYKLKHMIGVPN